MSWVIVVVFGLSGEMNAFELVNEDESGYLWRETIVMKCWKSNSWHKYLHFVSMKDRCCIIQVVAQHDLFRGLEGTEGKMKRVSSMP